MNGLPVSGLLKKESDITIQGIGPLKGPIPDKVSINKGSSRNRVARTRYYPDVNVPGGGVTLAEGIAWKAWLQSLSAKASRLDTLPGKHG
jgi:hypothetical protein